MTRCENCGCEVFERFPYTVDGPGGRRLAVCERCHRKIVRGIAQVERAVRSFRRAAA